MLDAAITVVGTATGVLGVWLGYLQVRSGWQADRRSGLAQFVLQGPFAGGRPGTPATLSLFNYGSGAAHDVLIDVILSGRIERSIPDYHGEHRTQIILPSARFDIGLPCFRFRGDLDPHDLLIRYHSFAVEVSFECEIGRRRRRKHCLIRGAMAEIFTPGIAQ